MDGGDSAAISRIFLASSLFCSQAESIPTPPPLTQTVSPVNLQQRMNSEDILVKRLMKMARKISIIFSILVVLYLGISLAFHFKWESELAACRETRRAQGEFVEPEVFGGILGLVFDVTNWPVYSWANIYHDGTPFATPCTHSDKENASSENEEATVRYIVEKFGKRLQNVSLQSPNAMQEMKNQYSEFVSPDLLETWANNISKAPGRIVSSPWPDQVEITTLTKEGSNRYVVTGFIVEITSMEVVNGGAAAKIPVRIVVQKVQGRWFITEYAEER